MSTFKIGDRVVLARPDELDRLTGLKAGMIGTVLNDDDLVPCVRWDGLTTGHTGKGVQHLEPGKPRDVWAVVHEQLELAGEPVPAEAGPGNGRIPFPPPSLIGRRIRITHGHALAPTSAEGVVTAPVVTILADATPGADTDEDGDYWVTLDHPVIPGGETMCVGTRDRFELID